jgi:hypothetical protein
MARGLTAAAAAEAVGVPPARLYRREKRAEPRSRRPRRLRARSWSAALIAAIEGRRDDFPMWSKRKLGPIPRAQGLAVSDSSVGRILAHLVRLGRAVPAPIFRRATRTAAAGQRRRARRLCGARKARLPGEAVQVDTLSRAFPGARGVMHVTAIDRLSRRTVAMAARAAPRPPRPPASSTSWSPGRRSRSPPSGSTAARNSWPSSRPPARRRA